jgi:hypothetical protein
MKSIYQNKSNTIKVIISTLVLTLFINCNTVKDAIYLIYDEKSQPTLTTNFISDMISNYRDNQWKTLNESKTKVSEKLNKEGGETTSVHFELEKLKAFIYHIELNAKKHKINSKDVGVKIHFAAYPEAIKWGNYNDLEKFKLVETHAWRSTVMMIPTVHKVLGNEKIHQDYNLLTNKPLYLDNYIKAYETLKKMNGTKENASNFVINDEEVLALNHGGAIPPLNKK